ncbi:MAG: lycopene cyclase domain-containing protein [Bacteroidetes bacterium]|nr:lycopene cyclase domain-containing protein [Bacteroidota bacterium]
MNNLYLLLDLFVILGPLSLSFDKRVSFYEKWKYIFPAIACMMLIFIPWDSAFTYYGIWGFNDRYILGPTLFYLPIEEWLFFPATHYACLFIYECVGAYFKKDILDKYYKIVLALFVLVGIGCAILVPTQLYSSLKMGGAALVAAVVLFYYKPIWLNKFTAAFLLSILPFLLMNGLLTGAFIEQEIVWYNPNHIFNIRIGTIPVEDLFYNLFMLLTTVTFYEWFRKLY